jgi:hypothetical protein
VAGVVSESAPVHVQALDIVSVDGQPVGPENVAARDLVTEIAALDPSVRPDEIGTPWPIQSPGFFSDAGSQGSVHLAFEMPGANSAAGGGGGYPAGAGYPAAGAPAAVYPASAPATPPQASAHAEVQQLAGSGSPMPLDASVSPAAAAKVHAMTRFADSVLGKPYIVGGGHGGWGPQPGYDCSGFVSAVLHAGGYLNAPTDTTALPGQPGIAPGPGKFVTIFDRALPGETGHVIIRINGQFYESGGMHGSWGGGGGVEKIGRPSDGYLATFGNVLHPEGL